MQFSSASFLILFLPGIMLVYYAGRKNLVYKNVVLLFGSLFFYAWGEPLFVFVMCGSIMVNYCFGRLLSVRKYRKTVLIISVLFNLGILFIFKYLSFVTDLLSGVVNIKICQITLPIGISFFTFQMMSYIFDVYYGKAKIQKNIVSLALYITMFPQLVAGPIVRYQSVENRIRERHETLLDFEYGIRRFAIGLSKKILLADFLGVIAERIFGEMENMSGAGVTAWLGAIVYTLEIYYDFSGYSDMAIGLGRCFGFHFKENFRYPYAAESITEFWKRWHISLTDWFRDYVYIPLGGNRVSVKRHVWNLLVVWTLTGIWHGANWTFLIWGLIYFVFQVMEKYLYDVRKSPPRFLRRMYTLLIVTVNWVIFRSSNLTCAVRYLKSMFFGWTEFWDGRFILYMRNGAVILVIAMIGCLPIKEFALRRLPKVKDNILVNGMIELGIVVSFILSVLISVNGMYSPFIYFNF